MQANLIFIVRHINKICALKEWAYLQAPWGGCPASHLPHTHSTDTEHREKEELATIFSAFYNYWSFHGTVSLVCFELSFNDKALM